VASIGFPVACLQRVTDVDVRRPIGDVDGLRARGRRHSAGDPDGFERTLHRVRLDRFDVHDLIRRRRWRMYAGSDPWHEEELGDVLAGKLER